LERCVPADECPVAALRGDDVAHPFVPGVLRVCASTTAEPRHRAVHVVHQESLHEGRVRLDSTRLEARQFSGVDEHLGKHDIVPAGQVGRDHREGGWADERAGRCEVVRPPADQGSEDVDVAVEDARVLVGVPPRQRGLADSRRAVEVDEADHGRTLSPRVRL
jgi:hypothetical protein